MNNEKSYDADAIQKRRASVGISSDIERGDDGVGREEYERMCGKRKIAMMINA